MDIAALVAWLATAGGGFFLLGTWIARGGLRQQETGETRFPTPLIFGHFLLAAAGLVVWIAYLISDESTGLAWTAFGLLVPVALLGFAMFFRWLPERRTAAPLAASAAVNRDTTSGPAERHFPVPVVVLHGLLAVTTVVLVLLAALDAS